VAVFLEELRMHSAFPLSLAALISIGIIVIGFLYIVSPKSMSAGFGLKPPALDADTLAWLRLKGIRDIASGVAVLVLMLTADHRTVGTLFLVFAIIPFGDMSNILFSGGRKAVAFSVHGVTCALMLLAGLLLVHAL
jgi:hypothetical protein